MAVEQGIDRLRSTLQPWGAPVDSLLPAWKQFATANNLTLDDLATGANDYFTQITPPSGNAQWWGANAWYRVPLQGAALRRPGLDWSAWIDAPREQAEQKALGEQLMAQQRKPKSGLSGIGALAAVAGIVTGGLGLIGAVGNAATVGLSGLGAAEATALASSYGVASASTIGAAGAGLSLGAAAGIARNAYSVAAGTQALTRSGPSGTPPANNLLTRNSNPMANPIYLATRSSDTLQRQDASPATVGKTAPPPGPAPILGMSPNVLALLVVAAAAWYAWAPEGKGS